MSNRLPWMPLDIPAYRNDTNHLTTLQHGAFLLLLMHYWCHGPLPDDDDQLAAIAKLDGKVWRSICRVIRSFFTLHNGELHQKRADAERERAADISAKRRGAANARHHPPPNDHANADANAPPKAPASGPPDAPPKAGANGPHTVPSTVQTEEVSVKKVIKINSLPPSSRARSERRPSDALETLLAEENIEAPHAIVRHDDEKLSDDPALEAQIRRAARAMQMRVVPYGEVRSVDAQLDAIKAQPQVVGADETMGMRYAPAENVNSVDAQIAAVLASATPAQLEAARRHTERCRMAR